MVYEYECTTCCSVFEVEQRIVDPPIESCPRCKRNVKRLVSGGQGFTLVGGGWYRDGYCAPGDGGTGGNDAA